MEQYMWIVWLSLFVIMVIVEASGPALVSVWFAIGALMALIFSFIPNIPIWAEVVIFVGVSLITFVAIRPIFKKRFKQNEVKSNIDSYVGKRGYALSDITFLEPGECKINDIIWRAIPFDEKDVISKDNVVEVIAIKGNKLIVKKVEEK